MSETIYNIFPKSCQPRNLKTLKKSKRSFVESTVSEYVKKSTIHGVSYVADDERSKFERIWWLIMLVFSIIGAVYLIYQAYRTMNDNPIIQSPALKPALVWEIPFPALTICSAFNEEFTDFALNKSNWPEFARSSVPDNLTEMTKSETFSTAAFVESLLLQKSDQSHYDIIKKVLPEINIISSLWNAPPVSTTFALAETITSFGACLTFNMYKANELYRNGVVLSSHDDATDKMEPLWNRDDGFKKGIENYTYPHRFFDNVDLFFIVFDVNQTKRMTPFNSRLVAFLHAPDETPIDNRLCKIFDLNSGKINNIEITARLIESEGLEKYKPKVRQCYYTRERYLKYYKMYTQSHCEWECLTNFTLAQCGCVPYHLPHLNDTRICGGEMKCYFEAVRKLFKPRFSDEGDDVPALIDACDCLPTCTQVSYGYHVTPISYEKKTNETTIYVSYKDPFIEKYIRSELHSISEFFSNCGGSLGLFLGVSIFSIIELVYFCTVRLYLHSKSDDRKKSTENINE